MKTSVMAIELTLKMTVAIVITWKPIKNNIEAVNNVIQNSQQIQQGKTCSRVPFLPNLQP
jgi:hypothetical protein